MQTMTLGEMKCWLNHAVKAGLVKEDQKLDLVVHAWACWCAGDKDVLMHIVAPVRHDQLKESEITVESKRRIESVLGCDTIQERRERFFQAATKHLTQLNHITSDANQEQLQQTTDVHDDLLGALPGDLADPIQEDKAPAVVDGVVPVGVVAPGGGRFGATGVDVVAPVAPGVDMDEVVAPVDDLPPVQTKAPQSDPRAHAMKHLHAQLRDYDLIEKSDLKRWWSVDSLKNVLTPDLVEVARSFHVIRNTHGFVLKSCQKREDFAREFEAVKQNKSYAYPVQQILLHMIKALRDQEMEARDLRAKQNFQPSNGTVGSLFIGAWCEGCKKHDIPKDTGCPILLRTTVFDKADREYPQEWCYDENQNPICSAFEDVEG